MGTNIPGLPYLTTVPHIDEGAHGVEGTCPAGQQVCPVVGMQHTDIVGTVSLGGQQEQEGSLGKVLCPPQLPATVGGPSPGSLGSIQAPCLQPGARDLGWQLVPTDRACMDFIWVGPSPWQNNRAFLLPRASQGSHTGSSCHLLPTGTCALTLWHSPRWPGQQCHLACSKLQTLPQSPGAQDVTRCRDILPRHIPAYARDETKGGNSGDRDRDPQASWAASRTALVAAVWNCPLL